MTKLKIISKIEANVTHIFQLFLEDLESDYNYSKSEVKEIKQKEKEVFELLSELKIQEISTEY